MLQSFLANSITNFLEEKRALGYSYKTDEQRLINFDKFVIDKYPEVSTLTQDIIMAWVDRDNVIGSRNYESLSNSGRRIFFLTQVKCPVIARDLQKRIGDWVIAESKATVNSQCGA